MKTNVVFLLFAVYCVTCCAGSTNTNKRTFFNGKPDDNSMDVSDFSIYYDLNTNETIKKMMPRPWYKPGWLLRLPFMGGRCQCEELKCSCCTGIRIQTLNFDRTTCALLTFKPSEAMLDLEVQMNNNTIFRSEYSAANLPPFCVPITVPYLPPGLMDLCVRLFDVNLVNDKLHVCMDMDTRIDKAPVLVLHFDCMDMGLDGVSLSKPSGSNIVTNSESEIITTEPEQLDFDVYDPVAERNATTQSPFTNSVKYI